MKTTKTKTTATFIKRGKMVFCVKTHQIFPSVQSTAEELKINKWSAYKMLEGKKPNTRGLFYVETMSDINQLFADQNAQARAEAEAKAKAERELAALDEEFARIEQLKAELRKKQAELKKKLN